MRRFGEFVLSGRWQAVFSALIITLLPLVSFIGVMIMALVTLRKGAREGAVVLFAVMLPDLIWAVMGHPEGIVPDVIYGSILVYGAALVLRMIPSWTLVVELSVGFGIFGVLMAHLFIHDINAWWLQHFQQVLTETTTLLNTTGATESKQNWAMLRGALEQPGILAFFAKLSTGIFIAFNIVGSLLNLVLARLWQASLFNPGGLRKELLQVRLHKVCVAVLLIGLITVWAGLNLGWDLLPLLVLPFFPAGISLIHAMAATRTKAWFWLTIFYFALIMLSPYSVMFVVTLAALDSLFNIRARVGTY